MMRSVFAQSGTLVAATPLSVDLKLAATSPASYCTLVLKNTGANAIGTTTISRSATGDLFAQDSTVVASVAAGASVVIEIGPTAATAIRVTMTSASGSTYTLEGRAAGAL